MRKVTIFGATGFIGSHVAEQMSLAGNDVDCIVRQSGDTSYLQTLNVNIITINFDEQDALVAAMVPDSIVCNCLADTRMHLSLEQRRVVDVDLTLRVFQAAQTAGVRRFIQLSTVMVYGFSRPAEAINEEYTSQKLAKYSYCQVAVERENALLNSVATDSGRRSGESMELIILRPSNIIGRRDTSFLPNFLNSHKRGLFPAVSSGQVGAGQWHFSLMDARDVGRAMVHLMTVAISKPEIYLVKGLDTDWLSFKSQLDAVLGKPSKIMRMPKLPMKVMGRLLETLYRYGTEPPLTQFGIDVMSTNTLFDDAKIQRSGFEPQFNLEESLTDALSDYAWFKR